MAGSQVGYVLPEDKVAVQALTTFPGLPGRFQPGVPLSLFHMEIEEEEADKIIEELSIPLEKVSMGKAASEEPIDRGDGHQPSGTEEAEYGAAVEAAEAEADEDTSLAVVGSAEDAADGESGEGNEG